MEPQADAAGGFVQSLQHCRQQQDFHIIICQQVKDLFGGRRIEFAFFFQRRPQLRQRGVDRAA